MDRTIAVEKENIIPLGSLLTDAELIKVQENSNVVIFNKKEIIFRQNTRTSHIMFIKSGMVKIFKEGRNGKYIILKVSLPGDFLGLLSIYGGDTHHYSASAIQPSEICFVDINVFNELLATNGSFSIKVLGRVANYGLFIYDRLMSQSHKQLPGRIADVILYFSEKIFKSEEFEFPFTRRELAELAGTTKESFIRTLAEFKHDKIIDLDGSVVKINSLKIVKTLSELG
jgi:CRP/FNR family transcriptional regulator, polysaccharide utilization system transcription regulator